jgi:hypothetical protein
VSLQWVERAVPAVVEIEDRHVEHEHWIVHSPATPEHISRFTTEIPLANSDRWFSLSKELEPTTVHFSSGVHMLLFVFTGRAREELESRPRPQGED